MGLITKTYDELDESERLAVDVAMKGRETAVCLNCGAEVVQAEGKRARMYCNDTCKKAFQRKAKLIDNGTKVISGHNGTAYRDAPTGKVTQAEINALPQVVKDAIKAELEEEQHDRSVRAAMYQRKFPDRKSTKPPEVIASRERSRQGTAKPGDERYPSQTELNTCSTCGCEIEWDVLDVCLPCSSRISSKPTPHTPDMGGGVESERA